MTFREAVQNEFVVRRRRNPRYSLRAFARALDTDHSTLSQILRGRRRITRRIIRTLGPRLGLTASQIETHCATENDAAVLEVIKRPSFRADTRWIATMAGITIDEVNVSLQRLLYCGTIEMRSASEWRIR